MGTNSRKFAILLKQKYILSTEKAIVKLIVHEFAVDDFNLHVVLYLDLSVLGLAWYNLYDTHYMAD